MIYKEALASQTKFAMSQEFETNDLELPFPDTVKCINTCKVMDPTPLLHELPQKLYANSIYTSKIVL